MEIYDYTYIIETSAEYGFIVHVLELPYVSNDGETPDTAIKNVQDDISLAIAALKDSGREIPTKMTYNPNILHHQNEDKRFG